MSGTVSGQFRTVTWYNRNSQCTEISQISAITKIKKKKHKTAIPVYHHNKRVLSV